jgi:hypothetical protein
VTSDPFAEPIHRSSPPSGTVGAIPSPPERRRGDASAVSSGATAASAGDPLGDLVPNAPVPIVSPRQTSGQYPGELADDVWPVPRPTDRGQALLPPTLADPFAVTVPVGSSPEVDLPMPEATSTPVASVEPPAVPQQGISASEEPVSVPLPPPALATLPRRDAVADPAHPDAGQTPLASGRTGGRAASLDAADPPPGRPTPPAPTSTAPTPTGASPPQAIQVDLEKLAAGIAGNNLSQRALRAELDDDSRQWSAGELGLAVDHLSRLVVRHKDLAMLWGLISAEHRGIVGRPYSPQPLITRAAARVAQARTYASGPNFTGSEAQRRVELQALDGLSRKLAGLGLE